MFKKDKKDKVDFSEIRNAQLLNEIDKVCHIKISNKYKLGIIKDLVKEWRKEK